MIWPLFFNNVGIVFLGMVIGYLLGRSSGYCEGFLDGWHKRNRKDGE